MRYRQSPAFGAGRVLAGPYRRRTLPGRIVICAGDIACRMPPRCRCFGLSFPAGLRRNHAVLWRSGRGTWFAVAAGACSPIPPATAGRAGSECRGGPGRYDCGPSARGAACWSGRGPAVTAPRQGAGQRGSGGGCARGTSWMAQPKSKGSAGRPGWLGHGERRPEHPRRSSARAGRAGHGDQIGHRAAIRMPSQGHRAQAKLVEAGPACARCPCTGAELLGTLDSDRRRRASATVGVRG